MMYGSISAGTMDEARAGNGGSHAKFEGSWNRTAQSDCLTDQRVTVQQLSFGNSDFSIRTRVTLEKESPFILCDAVKTLTPQDPSTIVDLKPQILECRML